MTFTSIDVSVKGKWIKAQIVKIQSNVIVVLGRFIKSAVVHDEDWNVDEIEDPELYIEALKKARRDGLHADFFTFTQKLPAKLPRYNYPLEWESVAAVDTSNYKRWWEGLPQETRKNVRRSHKRGVSVEIRPFDDELVAGIVDIINESPVRQGRAYPHYGKKFEEVKKDHSAFLDRSDFICAYCGSELIGFLKVVYRKEIASVLQLLVKASHQDKRPANALLAKAMEVCETRGVQYLTYARFNYGNKRNSPLTEFKARNGFDEILMPRYYVPLSFFGALCVRMGLHRGLLGVLPTGVIHYGIALRSRWYQLRQSISRRSSIVERPNRNRLMERSNPPAGSNSDAKSATDPQELPNSASGLS